VPAIVAAGTLRFARPTDFAIQTIQFQPVAIRRRYRRAAECWQAVSMTSKKTTRQDERRQDERRQDEQRPAAPEAPGRKPLVPPRKAGPAPDQERYELAMASINHGLYDWDIDKGTIYYSPTMRVIFRLADDQVLTPEESGGRVHPDDLPHYRQAVIDHLKGITQRFVCEYRYRAGDDTWHWARQSGIAQRGPDGHAIRMAGATVDITETKQREEQLSAARAEIEATREIMGTVLDNMNDGIVLVDKDFRWKFSNEQFNTFLNVPAEITVPGASVYDVLRFQALRGDFGAFDDIEAVVFERAMIMRTPVESVTRSPATAMIQPPMSSIKPMNFMIYLLEYLSPLRDFSFSVGSGPGHRPGSFVLHA